MNLVEKSICSLDNNGGQCLPSKVINVLSKDIIKPNTCTDDTCKVEKLKDKMNCSDEICIVMKSKLDNDEKNSLLFKYFKPIASVDPNDWLSNLQVDQIQEQMCKIYDHYYYSCIHMIDFHMIDHKHIEKDFVNIKDIDFVKELNGDVISTKEKPLKTYGVIFNTDPHYKAGQHWFAIFKDFRKKGTIDDPYTIEYFNSAGDPLEPKCREYLKDLADNISMRTKKNCVYVRVTDIEHQKPTTGNCGVYALYYIYSRINNKSADYFNKEAFKITDEMMEDFRKKIFNDEKDYK